MKQPEQFQLTLADKMDPLWRRLVAHWEERLIDLRKQNDADLTIEKTSVLRGRIAELKAAIALGNDEINMH